MPSVPLPSRPRAFKVIVEGITDFEPHAAVVLPTRWLSQLIIGVGLGKMKVTRGITFDSRYSNGCPRKYFIRVVVHFESTINEDLRTALECDQNIQLIYAKKGDLDKKNKPYPRDLFVTMKKYVAHEQAERRAIDTEDKMRRSVHEEKMRLKEQARHSQTGKCKNMFGGLNVEE
jgi:hypothetical protein